MKTISKDFQCMPVEQTEGSEPGRYCGQCGKSHSIKDRFCTKCGNALVPIDRSPENHQAIPYNQQVYHSPTVPMKPQYNFFPRSYLFNVSNLLNGIKSSYKNNIKSILVIYGAYYLIFYFISVFVVDLIIENYESNYSDDEFTLILFNLAVVLIQTMLILLFQWIPNTILYRVINNWEENSDENSLDIISSSISRWPSYLLFGFYLLAYIFASILVTILFGFINLLLGLFAFLLFLILFLYISLKVQLAPAYIMMEQKSARESLHMSWSSTNNRIGTLFITSILISLVAGIFSGIYQLFVVAIININDSYFKIIIEELIPQMLVVPLKSLVIISAYYLIKLIDEDKNSNKIFDDFGS